MKKGLWDVLMIGLIILGIGIPTGFINIGPVSAQLESDLMFRAIVVITIVIFLLGLILVFGLLKLNRIAQLLAGLIIIESVALSVTALDFGQTAMGFLLILPALFTMGVGYVIAKFFAKRAKLAS